MSTDRINLLVGCALCLAFVTNAGKSFESKVSQLLQNEPERIKCFTESLKDFTCFWEENHRHQDFNFTYQYQNEKSRVCTVSELHIQGVNGKKLFFCSIQKTQHFTPLELRVFQDQRELYNRSLFIDQVVLLDPPANLTVLSTGKEGELNVSWLPPAVKYIDDSLIYEIRYMGDNIPTRREIVRDSKFTLRGLQPGSRYKVFIRVKPDGITYDGYWSAWTDPEFGTTPSSDPVIVVLILIISLILILLALTIIVSYQKFLLKKLWPDIPSPEHKFPGLFTVYKGDLQEWLGHSNDNRWPVHVYTEELPSSLEVLSEVSLAPPLPSHTSPPRTEPTSRAADLPIEEPQIIPDDQLDTQDMDRGLIERCQEPPHSQWLMKQLRAFQEHPEVFPHSTLLESQDAYVTLNQNSPHSRGEVQRDDSFEESMPLAVLFASKASSKMATSDSDIGSLQPSSRSGRLSSQSSLEYPHQMWPPKGPGCMYMTVADSGVSMDYSPMSFSRREDMGNGTIYASVYKNDISRHYRPLTSQSIHDGH